MMRRTLARASIAAAGAMLALGFICTGCAGPKQPVTKEEETRWRNPPKTPPPEYTGQSLPSVAGPPAGAARGPAGRK